MQQKIGVIQSDGSFYPISDPAQGYLLQHVDQQKVFFQLAMIDSVASPQVIGDVHFNVEDFPRELMLFLSRSGDTCTVTITDGQDHAYYSEEFALSSLESRSQTVDETADLLSLEEVYPTDSDPRKEQSREEASPMRKKDMLVADDLSTIEVLSLANRKRQGLVKWILRIVLPALVVVVALAFGYLLFYLIRMGNFKNFFVSPFGPFS